MLLIPLYGFQFTLMNAASAYVIDWDEVRIENYEGSISLKFNFGGLNTKYIYINKS